MYDFVYHRPDKIADAVLLLSRKPEAKLLAGGMTLIPILKQRLASPSDLIDLVDVPDLTDIKVEDGRLIIGAMVSHASVAASPHVKNAIPALAALAHGIGDPHVRNRGTIGGSLANADPAADYPAAVVGLDATIMTTKRRIAADSFFTGLMSTALEADEIITAVSFPILKQAGYAKFPNPASRYAIVGVMVSRGPAAVRVAVTGARPCVFRVKALEEVLEDDFNASLKAIKVSADGLNGDIHAGSAYRAHLIGIMAARARSQALAA
jgi:aerobic carbon-monoxide dehydrogenase medium subunit